MLELKQETFNTIMENALKKYEAFPSRGIEVIADDCCRPYLNLFGQNMDSYYELIFQVTYNLANLKR